jgi:transcription factor E
LGILGEALKKLVGTKKEKPYTPSVAQKMILTKKPVKKLKIRPRKFKPKPVKRIKRAKPRIKKTMKKARQPKPVRKPAKKPKISKKVVKKVKKEKKPKPPKKPLVIPLEAKISKARTLKLIKEPEVMKFIKEHTGEEGYVVYDFLVRIGRDVDEYTLADKVNLQINFVRSLLYKLYAHKLVSFFRERDKKKGWFIYSWEAHPEKLKYILIRTKEQKIENLEKKLKISEDSFYCEKCDKTSDYAHAMETMFFCDTCGGHLIAMNSIEVKEKLERQIKVLRNEIEEIKKI